MELHSFDEIEKECSEIMSTRVYGKRKRFKSEIESSRVTKSLVQCGYLTRSLHSLLKNGASLEVVSVVYFFFFLFFFFFLSNPSTLYFSSLLILTLLLFILISRLTHQVRRHFTRCTPQSSKEFFQFSARIKH